MTMSLGIDVDYGTVIAIGAATGTDGGGKKMPFTRDHSEMFAYDVLISAPIAGASPHWPGSPVH